MFPTKIFLGIALAISGIAALDEKAYNAWYDNQIKGTLLSALEVGCDWVLPDAGILKKSYTVICPSNCLDVNHCVHVKGSGPYTVHSPVCLAAIHAGVIPAEKGGAIEVGVIEGKAKYEASTRKGISSIPYGDYFASINLKKSDVTCGPTVPPTEAPCVDSAILDLVFVADSSRSVGEADFGLEMKFISDISSLFKVSPTQSRIGLITFQTYPKTRFTLGKYSSQEAVQNAISAVPHETGGTYVGKALWKVVTDMKFRANTKVQKVVVVFTDGQSFDHVTSPVKKLNAQGVDLISFGVGDVDEKTLLELAAGVQDNVYSVANYGELKNYMGSLVAKICAFVNSPKSKK